MVLFFSSSAIAISDLISVNGRLMDSNSNVLNGTYTALFRFYNDTNEVLLENTTIDTDSFGFFTKQINVSNVSFLVPVYLGTTIENDTEMLPRTLITSVPSALYCENWEGSSDLLAVIASNYVPYTGATSSVDLGNWNLLAETLCINQPANCPYELTISGTGYASDGFIFDNTKGFRWGDSSVQIKGDAGPGDEYLSFITAGVEQMIINGTSSNVDVLSDLSVHGRLNATGFSSFQDKVSINYPGMATWGPEALHIQGDTSTAGYAIRLVEYAGDEYQSIRVDSSGDLNFYNDAGGIIMSMLDSVVRVTIGATTGSNTFNVNGNIGVGTYYSQLAPTNGLAVSGYSGFGTATDIYSYVQTLSFAGATEYVRLTNHVADDSVYTMYVNNSGCLNTTIILPACDTKSNIDRIYNIKFFDGDDSQVNVTINPGIKGPYIDSVLNADLILTELMSSVTVQCARSTRDYEHGWIIIGAYKESGVVLE